MPLALTFWFIVAPIAAEHSLYDVTNQAMQMDQWRQMLLRADYKTLEQFAAAFRERHLRQPSSQEELYWFYDALGARGALDASYKQQIVAAAEKWLEQDPQSAVALMAVARIQSDRAWAIRKRRTPDRMSPEEISAYERELRRAWQLLDTARNITPDPEAYADAIGVARDLSMPREVAEKLLKKGMEVDRIYDGLYISMAAWLLPSWGGSGEELHKFAVWAAQQTHAELGDAEYVRVAYVAQLTYGDQFKATFPFDWQRLRSALVELQKQFPRSALLLNLGAWFACHYGDYSTMRTMMARLGPPGKTDSRAIWGDAESFARCQKLGGATTP